MCVKQQHVSRLTNMSLGLELNFGHSMHVIVMTPPMAENKLIGRQIKPKLFFYLETNTLYEASLSQVQVLICNCVCLCLNLLMSNVEMTKSVLNSSMRVLQKCTSPDEC